MEATQRQAAGPLDAAFLEDWSRRWLEAWNDHDADRIVAMCAEQVRWHDPGLPEEIHGRAAVREFALATFRAFPDFTVHEGEPPYLSATRPKALSPYRFTGTMKGPWEPQGLAPTGARIEVPGVDEWEFDGQYLLRYDTHYDSLDMARQLGVLPRPGSAQDRLFARLQHGQARLQRRRS
jgi:steroid delta-isomerase-like uncharacterized protein